MVDNSNDISSWWMKLEELANKNMLAAWDLFQAETDIIQKIRKNAGYPWQMTFRAIISIHRENLKYKEVFDFIHANHNPKELPMEDKYQWIEITLGDIARKFLKKKDIVKAKEVIDFMNSQEVLGVIDKGKLPYYKHALTYIQCNYDIASGNYDSAITFYQKQLLSYSDPQVHLSLADVFVKKGDLNAATIQLMKAYKGNSNLQEEIEEGSAFYPDLLVFSKTEFYQKGIPPLPYPKDPILKKAYKISSENPYGIYLELQAQNQNVTDQVDRLGIQIYCLSIICSDLDEHGDANLYLYGDGKTTYDEFKKLLNNCSIELSKLIPNANKTNIPFWAYKNWEPRK